MNTKPMLQDESLSRLVETLSFSKFNDKIKKVADPKQLPTFEEAVDVMHALSLFDYAAVKKDAGFLPINGRYNNFWEAFASRLGLYVIPTEEFVEKLSRIFPTQKVVELFSRDGRIAYHLQNRGVYAVATNNDAQTLSPARNDVELISVDDALEKYKPSIVISTLTPQSVRKKGLVFGKLINPYEEILKDENAFLKYFMDINDSFSNGGALKNLSRIHNRRRVQMENDDQRYILSWLDKPWEKEERSRIRVNFYIKII